MREQVLEKHRMQPNDVLELVSRADRALQNRKLRLDHVDLQVILKRVDDEQQVVAQRPQTGLAEIKPTGLA